MQDKSEKDMNFLARIIKTRLSREHSIEVDTEVRGFTLRLHSGDKNVDYHSTESLSQENYLDKIAGKLRS